ncbi:holin family protein [Frigidibacter sp. RF13]|uniref:holin family protein n=1 Tax=Frigidibacter sp. RF13 TaxID=2997340 RepID=UPI00226F5E8E|nr:holin family protein [Frigidibacter sp. RF13]MCY1127867.1 holin family protein [Frigidibacter sp. RF13]
MGLIGRALGGPGGAAALGQAAADLAEVFTPNATRKMEAAHEAYLAAIDEHGAEFQYAMPGAFDRFVNGLNRLPRPFLAFGTLGLFTYAMVDPDGFSRRMVGLNFVPEPLWWLLTAIVGFYFGAREAHYFRMKAPAPQPAQKTAKPRAGEDNAALRELQRGRDR